MLEFVIASGEASEAAGATQSLLDAGLGDAELGRAFSRARGRTNTTLTGLVRRHRS